LFTKGDNWTWEHFFIKQRWIKDNPWLRGFANSYVNTALRYPRGFNNFLDKKPLLDYTFKFAVLGGAGASGYGGYTLGAQLNLRLSSTSTSTTVGHSGYTLGIQLDLRLSSTSTSTSAY
jgi:hypothetical protein